MNELLEIKAKVEDALKIDDIASKCRKREIVRGRKLYIKLCCDRKPDIYTLEQIGSVINVDHCSVIFHRNDGEGAYEYDPIFRRAYNRIKKKHSGRTWLELEIGNSIKWVQ